jgi:magnesium transporter
VAIERSSRVIKIHRSTESGLEDVDRVTKECWIEVTDPSEEEAQRLAREVGVPLDFLAHALDKHQTPLVERSNGAVLILVRIARFQGADAAIPYVTVPMSLILTGENLLTVCRHDHGLLDHLPHEHQVDLSTAHLTRLALHLLWSVANTYIRHLNAVTEIVESLEDRLVRSSENREVLELLRYQKSLVHFTIALRENEPLLDRLRGAEFLKLEQKDKELLDDVFTENHQAIALSEIVSGILSQMMDAFASIISNNLNIIMKFLAAITVILIVPTIVGTLYGMNVPLPASNHPAAFLVVTGVSILSSAIVAWVFWKRGWL